MILWMLGLLLAPASAAQSVEAEIESLVVEFNRVYERNDLDTYFAYFADDVTLWFDSGRVTLKDYQQDWYQLINEGGGVERNSISDIRVQVGPSGDSAIATYAIVAHTRLPDGNVSIDEAHETDVWFKRDGKWRLVHVHYTTNPAP